MSMTSAPSSYSPSDALTDRGRGRNRPLRRRRSAKIVATVGPASAGLERIRALFEAGVDVFRLNFSHGTHDEHRARFEEIRAVEAEVGRPIGILADLQGPKLRLGNFAGGKARLRVIDCGADFADTECLVGGTLSDHKGVNVPGAVLPISAMTEKDRADLSFALEQ